jgi:hypothetical protein
MIDPTPGRVVHYRPPGSHPSDQPHAAHIAFVHNARLVNLMIISDDGIAYPGTEIPLLQDGDPVPTGAHRGYAEWMPYQKGQAAKTEALQAQVAASAPAAAAQAQASQGPTPTPQSAAQAVPPAPPPQPAPATPAPQPAQPQPAPAAAPAPQGAS